MLTIPGNSRSPGEQPLETTMPHLTPVDHKVKHKSTIPANYNAEVELFVREYRTSTGGGGTPKPVLMLHGRSVPALPGFDLVLPPQGGSPHPETRYSWAQALAKRGYDVYVMDLQGSGLSPRPEMHDPCNVNPAQRGLLETHPGTGGGDPTTAKYAKQLGNSQSEWDELRTVVKFIRQRCADQKVAFIGWSAAAFVMGPYAVSYTHLDVYKRQRHGSVRPAGARGRVEPVPARAHVPAERPVVDGRLQAVRSATRHVPAHAARVEARRGLRLPHEPHQQGGHQGSRR
ncbi:alpha/beta fold hydrolase [Streptomyces fragilis]|uniref:alpha/beta fold hydrolase n=1 Tax=Streptomyces fragilis TaxID=67301 RepID=UPI0024DE4369|nr:alpha/beta fold hydrolase [Streptomyces fragilis]